MNFVPPAISRMVAGQVLTARKNSPQLLFGAGVVSMVGSTVLACRATLKLEEVLDRVESDKSKAGLAKEMVENGAVPEGTTYSEEEMRRDMTVITVRGIVSIGKLYAPSVVLGGIGIVCLTKSHRILQDRNTALTAAYVAVDRAFKSYRARVVDRFGPELDHELRYDTEEVDIVDEDTGKVVSTVRVAEGDHGMYARWFDETCPSFKAPPNNDGNWVFLRNQQNWANDMLRARGHLFLNEVYGMLGMDHTSAGAIVGWVYDRNNENGDNYVDFGFYNQQDGSTNDLFNGRDGAILLDFNVDGPIWDLIDKRNERT